MNRRKKVTLDFSGLKVLAIEKGTELLENLPKVFELRGQDDEGSRFSIQLMKTPVKGEYTSDIHLEYPEEIQEWK